MTNQSQDLQFRHATVIPAGRDDAHHVSPDSGSRAGPHSEVVTAEAKANADANATFLMPGSHPQEQIAAVSAEGAPADAHAGPAALRSLLLVFAAIIIVAAALSIFWIGWAGAVVVVVVGLGSLLLNPAIGATFSRAKERKVIIVIDKLHAQGIEPSTHPSTNAPPLDAHAKAPR